MKLPENKNDIKYLLMKLFIMSKTEKQEKLEELLFSKEYAKFPEAQLFGLQSLISNLNVKSIDVFHSRLLSFIDSHYKFCSEIGELLIKFAD